MKNWRNGVVIAGFIILLPILVGFSGCQPAPVSTTYSYFYPNWVPNGRIIATKLVSEQGPSSGGVPGFGPAPLAPTINTYYLVTMTTEGTDETTIRQINQKAKVSYSPQGNFIAYTDGNFIRIIKPDGSDTNSIDASATVDSLDWSPDEGRVVWGIIKNSGTGIFISTLDGTRINELASAGRDVTWRYGNLVIYFDGTKPIGERSVVAFNPALNSTIAFAGIIGAEYNVSATATSEAIFRGNGIQKFLLNKQSQDAITLFSNESLRNIKLSPNAQKIVATGDNIEGEQIWLINLNGTGLVRTK